jgi:hypothetical protein
MAGVEAPVRSELARRRSSRTTAIAAAAIVTLGVIRERVLEGVSSPMGARVEGRPFGF